VAVSGKARVLGIKKFVTNRRISLKKFKSFHSCTIGAKVRMSAAFSIYPMRDFILQVGFIKIGKNCAAWQEQFYFEIQIGRLYEI
jgi:hypothetical protein